MRDLRNEENADRGGGGTDKIDNARQGNEQATAQVDEWWENFARAVEDPKISTYDYLKDSFLKSLELDGTRDVGEFMTRAQQKALKELLELTDLKSLRKTLGRLQKNRLLFDYRTRVALQVTGVLLETFVTAREKYETEEARRIAAGKPPATEAEKKEQIEAIVREELADAKVAQSVEELAQVVTGRDKAEIRNTVEEAARQLQERPNIGKISRDVLGVAKRYFTLDNAVNVAVHALPLVTWQYRWVLAVAFGAYVSRMSVYHGYRAARARLGGDRDAAREEGQKAVTALKAAGGNALAIGISPLVGRLPGAIAGFASFAVTQSYNTALDISQALLRKKEALEARAAAQAGKQGVWPKIKGFFSKHEDTLVTLTAKAVKDKVPPDLTKAFDEASSRVAFSRVRKLGRNVWGVGRAGGRRLKFEFGRAAEAVIGGLDSGLAIISKPFAAAASPEKDDRANSPAEAEELFTEKSSDPPRLKGPE